MNNEPWLGHNTVQFWYYRFKDSVYYTWFLVFVSLLVSFIIIFQVIIPQLTSWFSITNEVIALREKISVMNQNINFVNNVDPALLNNQLQTAQSALPAEKDFGGVVSALSDAAILSGVSLSDYTFSVGEVASESAKISNVDVELVIEGTFDGTVRFLSEIEKKLPLAEIITAQGDNNSTTMKLKFYQKAYPKVVFHEDQPLQPLTDSQTALLRELSTWQRSAPAVPTSSSSSAVPLF